MFYFRRAKSKQHTNHCNKEGEDFIAIVCVCGNEHNIKLLFYMYVNSLNDSYSAIILKCNKKADSKESAFMANPVDYDTRGGCARFGRFGCILHPHSSLTPYRSNGTTLPIQSSIVPPHPLYISCTMLVCLINFVVFRYLQASPLPLIARLRGLWNQ